MRVALGQLDRVPEHRGLALGPVPVEVVDAQLALLAARGVHRVLEAVHRDLSEDGGDLTLEALGEQREPVLGVIGRVEQPTERDRLAEHRRGLGQGQRRPLVEHALATREVRVQAVAHLVREREHVTPARRPVQQQERVLGRDRVRAERARSLARPHRRVDPVLVEEPLRDVGELGRERARRRRARDRGPRPSRTPRPTWRPTPCGRSRRGGPGRGAGPSASTSAGGCRCAPCTASTSACTDSSLASLARFRLAIQPPYERRRSSVALSARSVLNTNARVRSPGARPSVTAAAACWRTDRSGDASSDSPCSRPTVSPSRSSVIVDVSSSNSRDHALEPVTSFSARIFSSGSESRCGR